MRWTAGSRRIFRRCVRPLQNSAHASARGRRAGEPTAAQARPARARAADRKKSSPLREGRVGSESDSQRCHPHRRSISRGTLPAGGGKKVTPILRSIISMRTERSCAEQAMVLAVQGGSARCATSTHARRAAREGRPRRGWCTVSTRHFRRLLIAKTRLAAAALAKTFRHAGAENLLGAGAGRAKPNRGALHVLARRGLDAN